MSKGDEGRTRPVSFGHDDLSVRLVCLSVYAYVCSMSLTSRQGKKI